MRVLLAIPLLLILIAFALSNKQAVQLGLWPTDVSFVVPVSLAVLGIAGVFFLFGAFMSWGGTLAARNRARRAEARARQLQAQLEAVRPRSTALSLPRRAELYAMAKVKICGVNTPEALAAAAGAGADWVGFVFFPRSPRFVTPEQAAAISVTNPGGPARIGLFVDPTDDAVQAALDRLELSGLQVYATAERAAALRTRFGVPVWHAVGVESSDDLPSQAAGVDALMLDAKPPAGATRPGGNAVSFQWSMLRSWTAPLPWVLAGGLTPANVADAIRLSRAAAVDVSTGVESAPGVKSADLIRAFVAAAKQA